MVKRSKPLPLLVIIVVVISFCAVLLPWRDVSADTDTMINGGFETGNLSGWTIGGLGGYIEVLRAVDFAPEIAVPEGSWFVLLSTGPGEVNLTLGPDLDGNGFPDNDSATLRQTFTLLSSQVPATLSFRWDFLSAETGGHDDFFLVTLDGTRILAGSVPGAPNFVSPFPDVFPLDQIGYIVTSYGLTDGSTFDGGDYGFQNFSYVITTAGSHNLQFSIVDQEDRFFDSGLLIDAVRLTLPSPGGPGSEPAPTPTPPTPTPPTPTPPTPTPPTPTPSTPTPPPTPTPTPPTPSPTPPASPPTTPPTELQTQVNWWLNGGIVAALIVIGITVWFLLIRRKGRKTGRKQDSR